MFSPTSGECFKPFAWCMFYASGIIVGLVIYGLLQERIMAIPYGIPPRMFTDSVFLVFCNRALAVAFSTFMVAVRGESFRNSAPLWKYFAISFSNVYASTCQYEALKYVSFPVQMLGKSFKMMPVMAWGIIVSNKKYGLADWIIATLVTVGTTEFLLTGPIASSSHVTGNSSKGFVLLLGCLFFDGFTSTFQEKLFKEHETSKYNQMVYVNLGSCVISSGTLIASGSFARAIAFTGANPAFAVDAASISVASVASQWFIYSQVKEYGALVFAATMNVRQVVSIIFSYVQYGSSISMAQVGGLVVIFGALFCKHARVFFSPKGETKPLIKQDV